MPCDCSHLEPTEREKESAIVASYIVPINNALGLPTEPWIVKASQSQYGSPESADELTAILCDILSSMSDGEYKDILIDKLATSRVARNIMTWWEDHKKADKLKMVEAARLAKAKRLKQSALSKLTDAEKRSLGL